VEKPAISRSQMLQKIIKWIFAVPDKKGLKLIVLTNKSFPKRLMNYFYQIIFFT